MIYELLLAIVLIMLFVVLVMSVLVWSRVDENTPVNFSQSEALLWFFLTSGDSTVTTNVEKFTVQVDLSTIAHTAEVFTDVPHHVKLCWTGGWEHFEVFCKAGEDNPITSNDPKYEDIVASINSHPSYLSQHPLCTVSLLNGDNNVPLSSAIATLEDVETEANVITFSFTTELGSSIPLSGNYTHTSLTFTDYLATNFYQPSPQCLNPETNAISNSPDCEEELKQSIILLTQLINSQPV